MRTRPKYWYFSLVLFFVFQTPIIAKDVCNDTDYEQVITDGENEQYIPPHMCVTVSEEENEVFSEGSNETLSTTIVEVEKPDEEIIVEVEEQAIEIMEDEDVQNSENNTNPTVKEEKEVRLLLITPIIISVLILMLKRARK